MSTNQLSGVLVRRRSLNIFSDFIRLRFKRDRKDQVYKVFLHGIAWSFIDVISLHMKEVLVNLYPIRFRYSRLSDTFAKSLLPAASIFVLKKVSSHPTEALRASLCLAPILVHLLLLKHRVLNIIAIHELDIRPCLGQYLLSWLSVLEVPSNH